MDKFPGPIESAIDKYLQPPSGADEVDVSDTPTYLTGLERLAQICGIVLSNDHGQLLVQVKVNDVCYAESFDREDALALIDELRGLMDV